MNDNSILVNDHPDIELPELAKVKDNGLGGMVRMILKKWWLFMLVGLIAGLAGVWYASTQKIVFKSRLTFALDNGGTEGGLSAALNLASQFGIGAGNSKDIFAGDNILEIMRSRRMVEQVLLSVDSFNNKPFTLIEFYLFGLGTNKKLQAKGIHFAPGQNRREFSYKQDSILYEVYLEFISEKVIAQRPDRKLSIYEVNVSTESEHLSKVFTDRLVAETNDFYSDISSKQARQTLNVLEQRVGAMKGGINSSIRSRAASQDANLNPAFSASQVPVLQQQVNMQVYSGAYAEMFKNLEMARFQYLKQIPLMQIIDNADYPMKKVKVGKLITGIKFSFIAALITLLVLWVIWVVKRH
jgi:hypothetical protein